MPARKLTAKTPSKAARRAKPAVLVAPPGTIPVLVNPPAVRKSSGKRHGTIRGIKVMRNPWVPDDIVILLKFVLTYGAGKYLFELIKLWMEYRNAQKIEIRVGDHELKIEGRVSDKTLEKRIAQFRKLIKGATYDDIDVSLPKGANRRIPAKLADKKAKRVKGK
jgi:hypothetical protein